MVAPQVSLNIDYLLCFYFANLNTDTHPLILLIAQYGCWGSSHCIHIIKSWKEEGVITEKGVAPKPRRFLAATFYKTPHDISTYISLAATVNEAEHAIFELNTAMPWITLYSVTNRERVDAGQAGSCVWESFQISEHHCSWRMLGPRQSTPPSSQPWMEGSLKTWFPPWQLKGALKGAVGAEGKGPWGGVRQAGGKGSGNAFQGRNDCTKS